VPLHGALKSGKVILIPRIVRVEECAQWRLSSEQTRVASSGSSIRGFAA
jgi:hypothetical protein